MEDPDLTGRAIFLAEDEHIVAKSLARLLRSWGATIIGPAATLDAGLILARSTARIDAAIVDINLRGEMAFPLADTLLARQALLIFTTGYDSMTIPVPYRSARILQKPYTPDEITTVLLPLAAPPLD
jgi:DNA-binding response OmpR family regulator